MSEEACPGASLPEHPSESATTPVSLHAAHVAATAGSPAARVSRSASKSRGSSGMTPPHEGQAAVNGTVRNARVSAAACSWKRESSQVPGVGSGEPW